MCQWTFANIIAVLFEALMTILHSLSHPNYVPDIQVTDEHRCFTGCRYDGRVARVEANST